MSEAKAKPIRSGSVLSIAIILIGLVGIVVLLLSQALEGEAESTVPLELGVELTEVAAGLDTPVLLIGTGDGSGDRLVVEQPGQVRRLTADGTLLSEPVIDLRTRVEVAYEQGLLGLALHPDHATNGRLFVAYTRVGDGALTIAEFRQPEGARSVDPDSAHELLTIPEPFANHNGGMVAFDRDGMLLVGVGDGGSAGDPLGSGQDRASLLGKLLRLDVDRGWPYALPLDNGFVDDREARPEIHALGLRNPWRFSVDAKTGHVFIGDVGQGRWEEVNVLAPGTRAADFGWAEMEGDECYGGAACDPSAHIAPAVAYPHADEDANHCSVIGGYVYRGESGTLPDRTYLYADYCSGRIWGADAASLIAGDAEPVVVGHLPGDHGRITSFGQDDAGELYLLTDAGYVLGISPIDAADPADSA